MQNNQNNISSIEQNSALTKHLCKSKFWRYSKTKAFSNICQEPIIQNVSDINNFALTQNISSFSAKILVVNGFLKKCEIKKEYENNIEVLENKYFWQNPDMFSSKHILDNIVKNKNICIKVKQFSNLKEPIILEEVFDKNASSCIILSAEEGTCFDFLRSVKSANAYQTISSFTSLLGSSSNVNIHFLENLSDKSIAFFNNYARLEENSCINYIALHKTISSIRDEFFLDIQASHCLGQIKNMCVAKKDSFFDFRTLQKHSFAGSKSDFYYKNALFDESKTVFSGIIDVEKNAPQSDAYQKNINLHLSKDSISYALPELEIKTNDVSCSHGASSSNPDKDELFYMRQRGLNSSQAENLLVYGFLNEFIENIKNQNIKELFQEML